MGVEEARAEEGGGMKKRGRGGLSDPLLTAAASGKDADEEASSDGTMLKYGGWKCMPFIIGTEACEKVATYGLTANLTLYLVGRYNMEQVAAVNMANLFMSTTNFTPLLGAFVSDAYWGRFRTIAYASVLSLLGMVAWTLTSMVPQLRPPSCSTAAQQARQCMGPTKAQLGFLFFSMGLQVVGAGGVRPCTLPFGADQFDRTIEHGKKGLASFFNWYYCASTAATMVGMTLFVYIQNDISWTVGFGIPTGFMFLCIIFFLLGTRVYIFVPPEGSYFSRIVQVFVASVRKRDLELPPQEQQELLLYDPHIVNDRIVKLQLTQQFRFLNKAAVKCEGELSPDGSPANPWRLCSVQTIEEVKCIIRIIPIWASSIICFLALVQQWTFTVLQSIKMDRRIGPHFSVPPASMTTVGYLALVFFIPIYDRILVPVLRRVTNIDSGITLLQRQGIGMVVSSLSMVVAAVVERRRRESALAHGGVSPMPVVWLVPQLVLMGIAEGLNAVGVVEFFNRQFPEQILTVAGSLFYLSLAVSGYTSSLLVTIIQWCTGGGGRPSWLDQDINTGRLDYFYYLIAALGVLNLVYFLICAHFYRYKVM